MRLESSLLRPGLWIVLHAMLMADTFAQSTLLQPLIDDPYRPAPPTNLRLVRQDGSEDDSIGSYLPKLKDDDETKRQLAAKVIFDRADEAAPWVRELAIGVTNKDDRVRRLISAALVKIGRKSYGASQSLLAGLRDSDRSVRANCALALGNLGESGSFAVADLRAKLSDEDYVVREYAAAALGNIGTSASDAVPKLIEMLRNEHSGRGTVIQALGNMGLAAADAVTAFTTYYPTANDAEKSQIAAAIAKIGLAIQDGFQTNQLPRLRLAREVIGGPRTEATSMLDRTIKFLELLQRDPTAPRSKKQKLVFATQIPQEILDSEGLSINDRSIIVDGTDGDRELFYLGDVGMLEKGLNFLKSKRKSAWFWYEENKLHEFSIPYKTSFAIIVAIDDYDRAKGNQKRPTGYRPLSFMVEHAKSLARSLEKLGFPKENILQYYNEQATSTAINDCLEQFWLGGEQSGANRVFFYFGGHGDNFSGNPCLITSDFDPKKPTLTSLLMRDLTGRHFEGVNAHHFLVAIDSCVAGLALPQFLTGELDSERIKSFRALSIVQSETEKPARNVIVSGTGNQKALWENGGIFTKALISGLKGEADYNTDRVIQFDELSLHVRNQVIGEARQTGVVQEPSHWRSERLGRGGFIFVRDGLDE